MSVYVKRITIVTIALFVMVGAVCFAIFAYNYKHCKIKITPIGRNVYFTTDYNPNAKTCVPAAYTDYNNTILGAYRIDGKTFNKLHFPNKISLTSKGLMISRAWLSKNGFQQQTLVYKGKAYSFHDPARRFRRALCNKPDNREEYFIIESTYPMTLSEFAQICSKHAYYAANLDMGTYGYGKVDGKIRSWWTIFWKNKQTNWICSD